MTTEPKIQQHPNQESKSGSPPFASPVKKNSSTNTPLTEDNDVARGVESEFRDAIKGRRKKKTGKKASTK